jgi:hypothetical protein
MVKNRPKRGKYALCFKEKATFRKVRLFTNSGDKIGDNSPPKISPKVLLHSMITDPKKSPMIGSWTSFVPSAKCHYVRQDSSCYQEFKPTLKKNKQIPLLAIYPKEGKSTYKRDTCTPMFTAALFIIAKLWNQPRCPAIHKWMKRMWYIYTMEY